MLLIFHFFWIYLNVVNSYFFNVNLFIIQFMDLFQHYYLYNNMCIFTYEYSNFYFFIIIYNLFIYIFQYKKFNFLLYK